jgi:hydroxyacylglutathione hydrolase
MTGLKVEAIESPPLGEVGYIAWMPGRDDAIVVDPGFDGPAFVEALRSRGLVPAAILNTHGHYDHIAGNAALKAEWPDAPLIIGRNEAHFLTDPEANLSGVWGLALVSPPADRLVDDGERLELAGIALEVREIPGHSPGSVVFVHEDHEPPVVFGGDVLFDEGIGRCDFPGGSYETLIAGIKSKLYTLPDPTIVLPGHGPPTTVGKERRSNPYTLR